MNSCLRAMIGLVFILSSGRIFADATFDWKPEATWKARKKDAVSRLISKAEQLQERGKHKKALRVYEKIGKKSVNLKNKGKAVVRQAECLSQMDKPWQAYRRYREAIDRYTNHVAFNDIIAAEYEIAESYFNGRRDRVMGFSISTAHKAMDIYDHVALVGPYTDLAPKSIYRVGLLQIQNKNYSQAIDKFNRLLTKYPDSDAAGNARIELARALLKEADSADGDGRLVRQANHELSRFIKRYPSHERLDEVKGLLAQAREIEAQRLLYLGQFYQRESHHNSDASKGYLLDVVLLYPETNSARVAEQMLKNIDAENTIGE